MAFFLPTGLYWGGGHCTTLTMMTVKNRIVVTNFKTEQSYIPVEGEFEARY